MTAESKARKRRDEGRIAFPTLRTNRQFTHKNIVWSSFVWWISLCRKALPANQSPVREKLPLPGSLSVDNPLPSACFLHVYIMFEMPAKKAEENQNSRTQISTWQFLISFIRSVKRRNFFHFARFFSQFRVYGKRIGEPHLHVVCCRNGRTHRSRR